MLIIPFLALGSLLFSKSARANIYADDAGFLSQYTNGNISTWWLDFIHYVPGRNFHIFWQNFYFFLSGTEIHQFWVYHTIQLLLYLTVGFMCARYLIRNGISKYLSLSVIFLMLLFPTNSVILMWASSLPMHITSTILLLFFLFHVITNPDRNDQKSWYINFLAVSGAILSLFTYDQSAAVVLFVTFTLFIRSIFGGCFLQNLPLRDLPRSLLYLLSIASLSYLLIFLNGRGLGNSLTLGSSSAERLLGNLALPIKIFSKITNGESSRVAEYFGGNLEAGLVGLVTLSLFGVLILVRVLKFQLRRQLDFSNRNCSLFFMLLSFVAFIPAATWYVAPRHIFLPVVLFSLGFAFILSEYTSRYISKSQVLFLRPIALVLVFGMFLGFNNQVNACVDRDGNRKIFYSQLEEEIRRTFPNSCIIVSQAITTSAGILYSESFSSARKFYAGNSLKLDDNGCNRTPSSFDGTYNCEATSPMHQWVELYGFEQSKYSPTKFTYSIREVCKG